ncbi:SDR family oxidoreductase [Nafulsella turpanensis]|uniref:SDR family oxidoreductase n=1 Tax=Nafulsella turpanensis TaxID=1265690 RepID=UPI001267C60F|nr:SDR family oxidoreductase [Nafulsella turpanensis]
MNRILITGATGQLGRLVVYKLKQKISADSIVALVRSAEKASDLGLGVEVKEGDYDKPETLQKALKDIDTLLLISSSEVGKRQAQHRNIINAAKQAGVKQIVYTSLLHADTSSLSLAEEHIATEADLKAAGIPYTVLRNGWYTENYADSIKAALASGSIIGSAGEGKISAATRADYADAAVGVLTSEGHEGKTYELAGDESFTLGELAAELSRQTGKNISYNNMPEEAYAAQLKGFGLPEELANAIASWDVAIAKGDLFDDSHQLSKLTGRPTTAMAAFVKEIVKAS